MKCPYCKGDVSFEPYVEYNVSAYGKPVVGRTACCGKGLRVRRVVSFNIEPLHPEYEKRTEDDWGVPLES